VQDYIYLHEEHSDWITKVQWIPELGLVTSSLDATIKTFDINRCAPHHSWRRDLAMVGG
jgi:WD40 repeat protein